MTLFQLKTYHEVIDEIYYQVKHLEPWVSCKNVINFAIKQQFLSQLRNADHAKAPEQECAVSK